MSQQLPDQSGPIRPTWADVSAIRRQLNVEIRRSEAVRSVLERNYLDDTEKIEEIERLINLKDDYDGYDHDSDWDRRLGSHGGPC